MMKGQLRIQFLLFILPLILFFLFFYYGFNNGIDFQIPSNLQQIKITGLGSDFLTVIGIPADWQFFPALMYVLIVPFLLITIVTFGFLQELNIFQSLDGTTNLIIALLVAFSTIPFGIFVKAVAAILATMGLYGALAFGVLYILGVGWVVFQKLGLWGYIPKDSTYKSLTEHSRYVMLRNWAEEVAGRNYGDKVVKDIAEELKKVDDEWHKPDGTGRDRAMKELEGLVRRLARRQHINRPPRPSGI